jgi:hypothetical protein
LGVGVAGSEFPISRGESLRGRVSSVRRQSPTDWRVHDYGHGCARDASAHGWDASAHAHLVRRHSAAALSTEAMDTSDRPGQTAAPHRSPCPVPRQGDFVRTHSQLGRVKRILRK